MEVNFNKTQNIEKIGSVDISKLILIVQELNIEDWDTNEDFEMNYNKSKTNNRGALNFTKHIIYRFVNKQNDPFEYFESSRWVNLEPILLAIMDQATEHLNYKNRYYPKVMLAKLPVGSFIPPHVDGDSKGYVPHKIHIPIQTNNACFFFLDSTKYHFEESYAYEVNNGRKHSVVNSGDTDRIHLIFECLNLDVQSEEIRKQIENRTIR
jgi:hypothetical protein